jgi:plastocyanin
MTESTRTPFSAPLARSWRASGRGHAVGAREKAAVIATSVALLAGCGGSSDDAAGPSSAGPGVGTVTTAPDGVQEITLQTQDDYVFTPDHFTVAPGQVRLTVVNVAKQTTHNFRFTPGEGPATIDSEISLLAPGQKETIDFDVSAAGDYRFECSFHTQLGQVGTMTVSG